MKMLPKDQQCPVCGKNIYISEVHNDFACVDINCSYGHGARSHDENMLIAFKTKTCGGAKTDERLELKEELYNFMKDRGYEFQIYDDAEIEDIKLV